MKVLFDHPSLYRTALKFAPWANHAPRFAIYNSLNGWGEGREMPVFAKQSFHEWWKNKK